MLQRQKLWLQAGLILCLLLGFSAGSVLAQTAALTGKVTDAQSGEGLPANVEVTASGVRSGAAADPDGRYTVPNLAAGTYTVNVTILGYDRKSQTVTLAAGETRTLNFSLAASGIELNPVVISASRRQEKALEAPAAVSVLEATQLRGRPAMTATDYLRSVPTVNMANTGIAQSNVSVRGFNGIFTGSLLALTDNRYAHVPSLRANVYSLIPLTGEDVSRIEVVSGPGSALYGPNSANGVMHIITRSPLESQGTSISVGGGGRDFFNFSTREPTGGHNIYTGAFRHASALSDKVGFKISGQYFQGRDWETYLPTDVARRKIIFGRDTPNGRVAVGDSVFNQADFDVKKLGAEARLDFRFNNEASLIFNAGFNQISQIELTGIGAGQGQDWRYFYGQVRLNYKNLFAQTFINASDAGDTYILRTGNFITDKSKVFAGQVQHSYAFGNDRQRFTYGVDVILTRPNTDGTITGRNENNDNINEYGAYVQSETKISPKLDLVLAGRIDKHNLFDDPVKSPRAALVFKASADHNLRATYNKAFSTPGTNDFFLDILSANVPNPLNPAKPLISIRGRGVGENGYTFMRGSDGRPLMYSQLAPGAGYVPATVNSVWPALRQILIAQSPAQIRALLNATLPPPTQLSANPVLGNLLAFNTAFTSAANQFIPVADVRDVPLLKPQITSTYEFGYKGVLGKKLLLTVDLYHSRLKDFDRLETLSATPNVFANPQQLAAAFQPTAVAITNALIAQGLPQAQAQAQATAIVTGLVTAAARLPLGIVTPKEIQNDTDVIITYRSFGAKEISLNGMDFVLTYFPTPNWALIGNYSFATKQGFNIFEKANRVYYRNVDGIADVSYNAPGNRIGLSIQYRNPSKGYDAEIRGRYSEGFPMRTGVYQGEVQTFTIFDMNWGLDLPFAPKTRFSLAVQNLFDKKHREFVGAPIIGRLILTRVTQTF